MKSELDKAVEEANDKLDNVIQKAKETLETLKKRVFKNKENPCYHKENIGDKKIYHSRSVAVCVIARFEGKALVLKRGEMLTHSGKWCLPCGYLDYDEDIYEAASRELFEEAGIFIPAEKFKKCGVYEIMSDPKRDELQNVTFHFLVELENDNVFIDEKEAIDYAWIDETSTNSKEFAFNHGERIKKVLTFFKKSVK